MILPILYKITLQLNFYKKLHSLDSCTYVSYEYFNYGITNLADVPQPKIVNHLCFLILINSYGRVLLISLEHTNALSIAGSDPCTHSDTHEMLITL